MARGDNSGLFALLDAMARRDQISESRMDRELRKDQLMLAIEEIRGQNSLNREKMLLDREKFRGQLDVEKARAEVDRKRSELDFKAKEMELNLQFSQLKIAQQQADDAHKRNEIDLDMIKDDRARRQIEDYRTYRQDVQTQREALVASITEDRTKNAEAYKQVLDTFGTVKDGKFEFFPLYKHLYEGYVRGSGLPKGTSQEIVAQVWAEEFGRQYRSTLNDQLAMINKNRKAQGLPEYSSDIQLSTVEKQSVLEAAYRQWMKGSSGPLAKAARGSMTQKQWDSLVQKHGGNEALIKNELLSMVRFSNGKAMTIGSANLEGYMDPKKMGDKEVSSALTLALMSFGPTAGEAVSNLVNTSDRLSTATNRYALLSKEEMAYSALESQASANVLRGRGQLTPEQEKTIKALNGLSWEMIGTPSEPSDQPDDPQPVLMGMSGGMFALPWLAKYKELLAQSALDEHALADKHEKATADPAAGAAAVNNVTGEKIQIPFAPSAGAGPWSLPAPAQFMGNGQAGVLRTTVEDSTKGKQVSSMFGSGFKPTQADSMNAEFIDGAKNIWASLANNAREADNLKGTSEDPSTMRRVVYPFFRDLVGGA